MILMITVTNASAQDRIGGQTEAGSTQPTAEELLAKILDRDTGHRDSPDRPRPSRRRGAGRRGRAATAADQAVPGGRPGRGDGRPPRPRAPPARRGRQRPQRQAHQDPAHRRRPRADPGPATARAPATAGTTSSGRGPATAERAPSTGCGCSPRSATGACGTCASCAGGLRHHSMTAMPDQRSSHRQVAGDSTRRARTNHPVQRYHHAFDSGSVHHHAPTNDLRGLP